MQKIFILGLGLFVVALSLIIIMVIAMTQQELRLRAVAQLATPTTPPLPTEISNNKINWQTDTVSLAADDFYIAVNGKRYYGNVANRVVRSDPGNITSTTLEATWQENEREMRMHMYFTYAPDGLWKLTELKTYNGLQPSNWVYYTPTDQFGQAIQYPLGLAYGNAISFDFTSQSTSPYPGLIHFENFKLQAFIHVPTPTIRVLTTPTLKQNQTSGINLTQ